MVDTASSAEVQRPKSFRGVSKFETRSTKLETKPKSEKENYETKTGNQIVFQISNFVLRVCFRFRVSDFGFESASPASARASPQLAVVRRGSSGPPVVARRSRLLAWPMRMRVVRG